MCWFQKSRFDARAAFSRNGGLLEITCRIDHDRSPEKLWLNSPNFLFDVFSACLISWFSWFYSEFDRDPECWRETCSSCSQPSPDPITSRRQDLSSAIHMEAGIHVSMMPDVTKSQDVIDWCLPQESLYIFITEHIGYAVTFCWWFSIFYFDTCISCEVQHAGSQFHKS